MSTIIIAEIGVNHNGSVALARQLVDMVAEAGADFAKFQTFSPQKLASTIAPKADYQTESTGSGESQLEMLSALTLSPDEHFELKAYCLSKGIGFLSSAFDIESLDFLIQDMDQNLIKFGSGELQNAPLLYSAARAGVDIILSTGMSILSDVEQALMVLGLGYSNKAPDRPKLEDFVQAWSNPSIREKVRNKVSVLHCTTSYPTPPEDVNLRAMDTLKQSFDLRTGFSDHTEGNGACIAAVARGAQIIEKHVTLDKSMDGPDHKASSDPHEFRSLVSDIRFVEKSLGHTYRVPTPVELRNAVAARKSLVAARDIAKGELFTVDNITVKRPGGGGSPVRYWDVLNTKSDKAYKADEILDLS